MLSIADTFRLKTYLRPSLLYPSEDWAAVEVFVKSRGLRKEWLNKLYLTYTRLDESEPHRSGVVLPEFFRRCAFSAKIEALVLKLFPSYTDDIVQRVVGSKVMLQGSAQAKAYEALIDTSGGGNLILSQGDRVVVKYYGKVISSGNPLVDPRVCCVCSEAWEAPLERVARFQQNLELNSTPEEDDIVLKEVFESEENLYTISFLQFALQLCDFLTLSYVELVAFAFTEIASCDIRIAIDLFHQNSSPTQRKILTTILEVRFEEDSAGETYLERVISFVLHYPAFCYPLRSIQNQLQRRVDCKPKRKEGQTNASPVSFVERGIVECSSFASAEADPPASLKDAWMQTSNHLLQQLLAKNQSNMGETQQIEPSLREGGQARPNLGKIKQSSAVHLFNSTRASILKEVELLEKGTKEKKRVQPKVKYGHCMGCKTTKRLVAVDLCQLCVGRCKADLAALGGYQFANGVLEAVTFETDIPDPIGEVKRRSVWIEQFDVATRSKFYYNVSEGSSVWELPKGTLPETIIPLRGYSRDAAKENTGSISDESVDSRPSPRKDDSDGPRLQF